MTSSPSSPAALVPCLPENAPFTPEQRAYLNGFLAGLFSRSPAPVAPSAVPAPASALLPLTILFGSQTGNAEALAKRAAKEAGKRGFAAVVADLGKFEPSRLAGEQAVLLITSTYGDGEPPDNAKAFWDWLHSDSAPRLENTRYSVLALGDHNYPRFCECGRGFDARLESLGAVRVHPRMDCDTDYDAPFHEWLTAALEALTQRCQSSLLTLSGSTTPSLPTPIPILALSAGEGRGEGANSTSRSDQGEEARFPALDGKIRGSDSRPPVQSLPVYTRQNPFPARLTVNCRLTPQNCPRDRRHLEISIAGSGLAYEAGDALGVMPSNPPQLVEQILDALQFNGNESVNVPGSGPMTIRETLLHLRDVQQLSKSFLEAVSKQNPGGPLEALLGSSANGHLKEFLYGRDLLDVLVEFPATRFPPEELVALLPALKPRLYSIASSSKPHPESVHLTIAIVRYEVRGRARTGLCSGFLADRAEATGRVPVFVQPNKRFRVPSDGDRPIIMVGPGTGIAPFRAFLQEREATGARGKAWLLFGEQHAASDFFYRDELQGFLDRGILTRLDTAFSRDQADKIYVQHRMKEHARAVYDWLQNGAYFYVCGDASRMAKDVDQALRETIRDQGSLTAEQADDYVERLKTEGRYARDVY